MCTNLLWVYIECEQFTPGGGAVVVDKSQISRRRTTSASAPPPADAACNRRRHTLTRQHRLSNKVVDGAQDVDADEARWRPKFKHNNPFLSDCDAGCSSASDSSEGAGDDDGGGDLWTLTASVGEGRRNSQQTASKTAAPKQAAKPALVLQFKRKIFVVDTITFDVFSAFTLHPSFGEMLSLRTCLVAYCQFANQFSSSAGSSRIIQINPTGHYERLLSFSDLVDYMITVPDSYKQQEAEVSADSAQQSSAQSRNSASQRYLSLRGLLRHSMSLNYDDQSAPAATAPHTDSSGPVSLTRYYRSLMRKSHSTVVEEAGDCGAAQNLSENCSEQNSRLNVPASAPSPARQQQHLNKAHKSNDLRTMITSSLGNLNDLSESNYLPINMTFIFRNGKIALFEFTEGYAIHTREAQLDRRDYSRVIDVTKRNKEFIVTILTVADKLIKVII